MEEKSLIKILRLMKKTSLNERSLLAGIPHKDREEFRHLAQQVRINTLNEVMKMIKKEL